MTSTGGDVRQVVSACDGPAIEDRLDALLTSYGAFLRGAIRRVCPATFGISVDEIEQDARIRLWHALRRERNIADPASYLYRIAATAAIDAMRRVRARREHPLTIAGSETAPEELIVEPPSPDRSPEQLAADHETSGLVQRSLARLRVNRRRAVGLHLRGFTSTEIANLLGWTEPKARNLTHRGLKDLRELLKDEGIALP
jgi:RNA polymerase sigma factor (sigma-70 family)